MPKRPNISDVMKKGTPEVDKEADREVNKEAEPRESGRPVDPASQRQKLLRGDARPLKIVLPLDVYRRLAYQKIETGRDMSEMASEAIREWLEHHES